MHDEKSVTARQSRALDSLAGGESLESAAAAMGVNAKTLSRWMSDPAFVTSYRQARRAALEMNLSLLARSAGGAVEALGRAMTCGSPAVEVAAAKAVVELSVRALEIHELAGQLDALQRAHDARAGVPVPADGGEAGDAVAGDDDAVPPLFT